MVTKAIIEKVNINSKTKLPEYLVRLPIFHGLKNTKGATNTGDLPKATYCSAPHTEETTFSENDIVLVALEDFSLEDIIIIGMIPKYTSNDAYNGSATTKTKGVYKNISTLEVPNSTANGATTGTVRLPEDVEIGNWDDTTNDRDPVTAKDISYLKHLEYPIQEQLTMMSTQIRNVVDRALRFRTRSFKQEPSTPNCTFDENTWKSRSGLLSASTYIFRSIEQNSTIVWSLYKNNQILPIRENISFNVLEYQYGLSFTEPVNVQSGMKISFEVYFNPLPISEGGTGADTKEGALNNFELFKMKAVDAMPVNPEANTIYFLYSAP